MTLTLRSFILYGSQNKERLLLYKALTDWFYTECPTRYRTRHFFNNSNTNEDIATKQTHTTDTFLFISDTTNVLLFKFRCNIFISVRIIKETAGSVAGGTSCITGMERVSRAIRSESLYKTDTIGL